MMRSPRFSKRSLMAPVRLRRVASGLMINSVRSMPIQFSRFGGAGAGYIEQEDDGQRRVGHRSSRFALPARRRLLPISQIVPRLAGSAPAAARRLHGIGVVTVKQIGAARKGVQVIDF